MPDHATPCAEHPCPEEPAKGPDSSPAPWHIPPGDGSLLCLLSLKFPECRALPPPPSSTWLGPCSYIQETIKLYRVRLERNRNCCSDCQKGQRYDSQDFPGLGLARKGFIHLGGAVKTKIKFFILEREGREKEENA